MVDGLRDVEGKERIAFKGGSALQLRFGHDARATRDLDGSFLGEVEEARELIDNALRTEWCGFTGSATEGTNIERTGLQHSPLRFKVKLRYKAKDFITIAIELSQAEGQSLDEIDLVVPVVPLHAVQLPAIDPLPLLPIRYQIATKLHACTEDLGAENPNQRARDLLDLLLIEELAIADGDHGAIRAGCLEVFELRGKHPWPPEITVWPGWESIWAGLMKTEGTEYPVLEAAKRVRNLIRRIEEG